MRLVQHSQLRLPLPLRALLELLIDRIHLRIRRVEQVADVVALYVAKQGLHVSLKVICRAGHNVLCLEHEIVQRLLEALAESLVVIARLEEMLVQFSEQLVEADNDLRLITDAFPGIGVKRNHAAVVQRPDHFAELETLHFLNQHLRRLKIN